MAEKVVRRFKKTSTALKPKRPEDMVFKLNSLTEKYGYLVKFGKGIKIGLSKLAVSAKRQPKEGTI